MSRNMATALIFFPHIYLWDCDYFFVMLELVEGLGGKVALQLFPLPQKQSRIWYSVTSLIAHIYLPCPAASGGTPQPSILLPSCEMCRGLLNNIMCVKLQPRFSVLSEAICVCQKQSFSKRRVKLSSINLDSFTGPLRF